MATSFDWSRKVAINLVPALQGATTYLALVAKDGDSNPAAVITAAPAYIKRSEPTWSSKCVGLTAPQVKVSGSMKFTVSGLQKTQVEAAAKEAIAVSLDVSWKLVTVSASKEVPSGRRLAADSWAVSYEVLVAETKGKDIEKAAKLLAANPAAFKTQLVTSLESAASLAGTDFDATSVAIAQFAAPTNAVYTTTTRLQPLPQPKPKPQPRPQPKPQPLDKPSGSTETKAPTTTAVPIEGNVDSTMSSLLSSAVVGLVVLVGSM